MSKSSTVEINITPLVDRVLVLLILFMVLSPLAQSGYDILIPAKTPSAVPLPNTSIVVELVDSKLNLAQQEKDSRNRSELGTQRAFHSGFGSRSTRRRLQQLTTVTIIPCST